MVGPAGRMSAPARPHARALHASVGAVLSMLALASPSGADVIVFTSGRVLQVQRAHATDDVVTVTLPRGGEATFPRAIVLRIDAEPSGLDAWRPPAPHEGMMGIDRHDPGPRPFAGLVEAAARRHGLDPALIHAVIEAESSYRPRAISPAGARGLMQVMPSTARDLGLAKTTLLFDPRHNIETGARYLKLLLERFGGDLARALAAYNAGPAAVLAHRGVPPHPETRHYVRKILSALGR